MPVVVAAQLAEADLALLAPVALEMEFLVQPTQAVVAVVDLDTLRPIQMAALAALASSSSNTLSPCNLS
jgi:hypothetical protein